MNAITNPVERYVAHFPSVSQAAAAVDRTYEWLRLVRAAGVVGRRSTAAAMELACGGAVTAAELMGFGSPAAARTPAAATRHAKARR
jgi:hypothetical protein